MKKQKQTNDIVMYQGKDGGIELKIDGRKETLWASQAQIAELFGVKKSAISKHLKNIFESGELIEKSTVSKVETVQIEGKREVVRMIEMYNLDSMIAVGYRVNSKKATHFRIWATGMLREFLTKGYIFNRKHIQKNYSEFIKTIESIQDLLPKHINLDPKKILDLIKEFSGTWMSLDAYDKDSLRPIGTSKKSITLSGKELRQAILNLKTELIRKGEATQIFAQEINFGSIEGIVGNIMQSIHNKYVYKTIEEKAAHLLYFIVKNHPFIDGNKRSGAFSFI